MELARGTPGFSGADLENVLNEAALLAARKNKRAIEAEDVEEARDKVLMGLARENLALTAEELRVIAYHEHSATLSLPTRPCGEHLVGEKDYLGRSRPRTDWHRSCRHTTCCITD